MTLNRTALILIGYQNDYFAPDGILHPVIEEAARVGGVLGNTLGLLERLGDRFAQVVKAHKQRRWEN